jgi:hypothetical protein
MDNVHNYNSCINISLTVLLILRTYLLCAVCKSVQRQTHVLGKGIMCGGWEEIILRELRVQLERYDNSVV